jgi:hypothetical protein
MYRELARAARAVQKPAGRPSAGAYLTLFAQDRPAYGTALIHVHTAVYVQRRSRNVACIRRRQKNHRMGDIVRLA